MLQEFDIASGRRADVAGALAAIQALTHAHLAPVLIAVAFEDVAHIVIPWMRLMSLEKPLAAAPVGIARGMQYLHQQGVAHLLLTSKCIFVRAGGAAHGDSVWVAEYGFSTLAPMCFPGEQRYEHLVRDGIMYLAPERFVQSNWVRGLVSDDSDSDPSIAGQQKADVYSFGVLLAAMANRSEPPVTTETLASAMRKLVPFIRRLIVCLPNRPPPCRLPRISVRRCFSRLRSPTWCNAAGHFLLAVAHPLMTLCLR